MAFVTAYKGACEAAGLPPSSGVLGASSGCLAAAGNVGQMRENRLTDADMTPIVTALLSGHDFDEINLSYNRLGAGAVNELKPLLQSDMRVRALNLAENDIGDAAAQQLCAALKGNATLEELSLSGNKLGGIGGLAVADLLQSANGLKRLGLSNCELTTEALVALATVLQANDKLVALDVSRSLPAPLMEEATSHFSRMLKVNASLVELDLSRCGIRAFGLQLLAEELFRAGEESHLTALRLKGNEITLVDGACVAALHNLLGSSSCRLNSLILGSNTLKDEGALKFADILSANSSLVELDLER